jgi:hypothetical protein
MSHTVRIASVLSLKDKAAETQSRKGGGVADGSVCLVPRLLKKYVISSDRGNGTLLMKKNNFTHVLIGWVSIFIHV